MAWELPWSRQVAQRVHRAGHNGEVCVAGHVAVDAGR